MRNQHQRRNNLSAEEQTHQLATGTETSNHSGGSSTPSPRTPVASPDGGYGWICVLCSTVINAHTYGAIAAAYGVFLSRYLSHSTYPGTTATTYAFIGGLILSQAVLTSPLATYLVKVFGTRACLFVGNFWLTLGLITASFAEKGYQIVLSQGICSGWGIGFLFVGQVAITSQWFEKKRSLANAIVASGTGIGALIYSVATQRMIENIGLRWTFRILAIVCFAVNAVASLLLRDRNKVVGSKHHPFRIKLMKRPEFLSLQVWSLLTTLGYTGLAFSVSAQAISIGLTASQGALLNSLYNLGQAVGRPLMGLASDRFGRINVALVCTALSGVMCLAFWIPSAYVSSKFGLLIFFNIISGTVTGVFWTVIAAVTTEVVGLPELPSALGMIWLSIVPSTMFAEPISLAVRWHYSTISFIPGQVFISIVFIAAIVPMSIIRGWKIEQAETHHPGAHMQANERTEDDKDPNERSASQQGSCSRSTLFKRMFAPHRV